MLNNLKKLISETRKEEGRKSILAFAKHYFGDHLKLAPSRAHLEIYDLLTDISKSRYQKLAVAAPRGFGKSTLITLIYVVHCVVYGTEKFIVVLSDTSSQANQILENIKRELTSNWKLLEDFPELAGKPPHPWTKSEIETHTGIRLLALGTGQKIRGRRFGKYRPTLTIADDIETAANTFSLDSREKLKAWFNSDILKVGGEDTNYLFLGTLQHPDCLLAEYVDPEKNPQWIKRVYRSVISWATHSELWAKWSLIYNYKEVYESLKGPEGAQKFYESQKTLMDEGAEILWPEKWSYYTLMEIYESDPVSFNSELQNTPLNPRDCIFDIDTFHYWSDHYKSIEELLSILGDGVEFYGACDPSTGLDTKKGDYSSIVVLARNPKDGVLYQIVNDLARRPMDQIIEDILAYARKYDFSRFAVESNQFQEGLVQILEKRSRETALYVPLERIKNTTDKVRRIQSLQPLLKSGSIHVSKHHRLFLEQCRYFPKGKHDDGLDGLEMAVKIAAESRKGSVVIVGGDSSHRWRGWLDAGTIPGFYNGW